MVKSARATELDRIEELYVTLQDTQEECHSGPKENTVLNQELYHRRFSIAMFPRYLELVP